MFTFTNWDDFNEAKNALQEVLAPIVKDTRNKINTLKNVLILTNAEDFDIIMAPTAIIDINEEAYEIIIRLDNNGTYLEIWSEGGDVREVTTLRNPDPYSTYSDEYEHIYDVFTDILKNYLSEELMAELR